MFEKLVGYRKYGLSQFSHMAVHRWAMLRAARLAVARHCSPLPCLPASFQQPRHSVHNESRSVTTCRLRGRTRMR